MTRIETRANGCVRCVLHKSREQAVGGDGDPRAPIMLVGQAPGEEEERTGRLWSGRAGEILDDLLDGAGLARDDVYATNLLKCRLPGYRRPKIAEIEACFPFLLEEIEIVKPRVIAPLGYYPTKTFFAHYDLGNPSRDEYAEVYGTVYRAADRLLVPLRNPAALIPAPEIYDTVRAQYRTLADALNMPLD